MAKGDRRGYVIVDMAGEVHSLTRQIKDAMAKDIKAKLDLSSPDELVSVQEAKRLIVDRTRAKAERRIAQEQKKLAYRVEAQQAKFKAVQSDHTATLKAIKLEEVTRVANIKKQVKEAYREEWTSLFKQQDDEKKEIKAIFKSPVKRFTYRFKHRHLSEKMKPLFQAIPWNIGTAITGKIDLSSLKKAHAQERRELGNMLKLATREEVKAIKLETAQKRKDVTKSYKVAVSVLKTSIKRSTENQESKGQGKDKKLVSPRKAFSDRVKQATSTKDFKAATRDAKAQVRKEQEQTQDNSGRSKF